LPLLLVRGLSMEPLDAEQQENDDGDRSHQAGLG
jgi:hypothetical protein